MPSELLSTPVIQTLGATLLHFLWQGTVLALGLAGLLYTLRTAGAVTRYRVGLAGLALMLLLPTVTFGMLTPTVKPVYSFVDTPSSRAAPTAPELLRSVAGTDNQADDQAVAVAPPDDFQTESAATFTINLKASSNYLPFLVLFWLVGVALLSVRLLGGLLFTRKLRRRYTKAVSKDLEQRLANLSRRLNLTQAVQLRESLAVTVPLVVGWLKPVILLPSSSLSGLSTEQLEMIIAHELAHVRRNDYLANVLQSVAETLLFYHPAVWWLSGVIRQERENCCDDIAVALCNDRLAYAKTLARLDDLKPQKHLALAANGGTLMKRIERLAGISQRNSNPTAWVIGLALILIPYLVFSVASAQAKLPVQLEENIDAFVDGRLDTWGVPGMQVAVIQDGQLTFNKAYGVADVASGRAMTVDTPIQLGSGSWLVHALAAMQLVDAGKLSLDDTIAEHLPWLEFKRGEENEILLRHLIFGSANIADNVRIAGLQIDPPSLQLSLIETFNSKEAYLLSLMPEQLSTFAPAGSPSDPDYRHINNDIILSLIIEKASGLSLASYVQSYIFLPLGINASYVKSPGEATLYQPVADSNGNRRVLDLPFSMQPLTVQELGALSSPLGLSMSSRDFATLLNVVLSRDPKLLSVKAWDTLTDIYPNGWGAGGWWYRLISGQPILSNIGMTEGSQVFFEVLPDANTAYITMTNFAIFRDDNPLYEVLGSVSSSLMLLNGKSLFKNMDYNEDDLYDIANIYQKRVAGSYSSALGDIEVIAEEDGLRGVMLGHDVVFKRFFPSSGYIIVSDYKPLDGAPINFVLLDKVIIKLWSRQFAYQKTN